MKARSLFAAVLAVGFVFATGTLVAAETKKKAKSARVTGAAGAAGAILEREARRDHAAGHR